MYVLISKDIVTFEKVATRINERIPDPERRERRSYYYFYFPSAPPRKILNIVAHLFAGMLDAWQRYRRADTSTRRHWTRPREKYKADSGREGTQDLQREATPKDHISEKRIADISV